jgi:hypothetical protein
VNVLGHTFVARATGPDDPEFLLGAVLPDLAPMAGVRLARGGIDGVLGAGVRCHLRTDDVFHGDARFRQGMRALRTELAGRGVDSGPARAVGHAGWELLLDGTLVGTATAAEFAKAVAVGERALPVLAAGDRPRWAAFLARARASGDGLRYDDPDWVADRLHAMLARRPRLRLPAGQVTIVAAALGAQLPAVRSVASEVLADTTAAVAVA